MTIATLYSTALHRAEQFCHAHVDGISAHSLLIMENAQVELDDMVRSGEASLDLNLFAAADHIALRIREMKEQLEAR